MTTRAEIQVALDPWHRKGRLRTKIKEVDIYRQSIRRELAAGLIAPGTVVEQMAVAGYYAEDYGFNWSTDEYDPDAAQAAFILEGMLVVILFGDESMWALWPTNETERIRRSEYLRVWAATGRMPRGVSVEDAHLFAPAPTAPGSVSIPTPQIPVLADKSQ